MVRLPRKLLPLGNRLELKLGKLGREYQKIVFHKAFLKSNASLEWVAPGHSTSGATVVVHFTCPRAEFYA